MLNSVVSFKLVLVPLFPCVIWQSIIKGAKSRTREIIKCKGEKRNKY